LTVWLTGWRHTAKLAVAPQGPGVDVDVAVEVLVGVRVGVEVRVGVDVGQPVVGQGVCVAVFVGVFVRVGVFDAVGVFVAVFVEVAVGQPSVGQGVGVSVGVRVGVTVRVGVAVAAKTATVPPCVPNTGICFGVSFVGSGSRWNGSIGVSTSVMFSRCSGETPITPVRACNVRFAIMPLPVGPGGSGPRVEQRNLM
jgi:hypothetical protein